MGHSCSLKVSVNIKLSNWNGIRRLEVNQMLLHFALVLLFEAENQLGCGCSFAIEKNFVLICCQLGGTAHLICIGNGCINQLKNELSSEVLWNLSWRLHLCCGIQCFLWWANFFCWSYGLKCKQCKGMMWNFWSWRYLNFYRKGLNPTSQSWTQIRTDSREGNAGRWETLWACQAQLSILICHSCC